MISQRLWKKRSRDSNLGCACDLSIELDVLSMHEWFFPWWQSTQDILSLSQWSILIMVHMRVLKRKARTEVEGWIYSSKDSWSWVIKYSFEIRHWQMGECLGNFVRIHSVHSKLKSVLEQLRINVYRCALLCWLDGSLSNVWNISMSSRK